MLSVRRCTPLTWHGLLALWMMSFLEDGIWLWREGGLLRCHMQFLAAQAPLYDSFGCGPCFGAGGLTSHRSFTNIILTINQHSVSCFVRDRFEHFLSVHSGEIIDIGGNSHRHRRSSRHRARAPLVLWTRFDTVVGVNGVRPASSVDIRLVAVIAPPRKEVM